MFFIYQVEIVRAANIILCGYSRRKYAEKKLPFETKLLYDDWTRDLTSKAKKEGNLYHVRSYLRWILILTIFATLQLMNIFQISLLLLTQGGYLYLVILDTLKHPIFKGKIFNFKYLIQEALITVAFLFMIVFASATRFDSDLPYDITIHVFFVIVCSVILIEIATAFYKIALNLKEKFKKRVSWHENLQMGDAMKVKVLYAL